MWPNAARSPDLGRVGNASLFPTMELAGVLGGLLTKCNFLGRSDKEYSRGGPLDIGAAVEEAFWCLLVSW